MNLDLWDNADGEALKGQIPTGRCSLPDEIARPPSAWRVILVIHHPGCRT